MKTRIAFLELDVKNKNIELEYLVTNNKNLNRENEGNKKVGDELSRDL